MRWLSSPPPVLEDMTYLKLLARITVAIGGRAVLLRAQRAHAKAIAFGAR